MATNCLPDLLSLWIATLAVPLHARLAFRLAPIFVGILFVQGRQTVAAWLRAANLGKEFKRYYYFLGSVGRKTNSIAGRLLHLVVKHLGAEDRILLAIDDTPTKRFGPHVEGAGVHHNPTPGPAEQTFVYGHVWVTMSLLCHHGLWGTIGLPLLARLYVRKKNLGSIPPHHKIQFQTKLEQAAELIEWAANWLRFLGKPLWVVADGAYAKRKFLKRAMAAGYTVVSRLRKDAALWDLPIQQPGRGRPRKYGVNRFSLAKRAGANKGWQREEFVLYGKTVTKRYKTFLATYRPAYGVIRVVLVKEVDGWFAFFCTDPDATVAQILEAVADRSAIEQDFHDIKEIHGAGKQQLRNYYANLAAYHLNLWMHTLIELWAWDRPHATLCNRERSPWDDPNRRPSHADRRNALRRACIDAELSRVTAGKPLTRKIKSVVKTLVAFIT